MDKVEMKARITKTYEDLDDLIADEGVMYRSALYAFLSAASNILYLASKHYEEYLEIDS